MASASSPAQRPTQLIGRLDETQAVTLDGNVHPLARPEFDQGTVSADTRLDRILLALKPSASQQAALEALVEAQHDPRSPLYHQWLTPAEFGARFGVSSQAINQVTAWLLSHGFSVDEIPASHRLIVFSGTAGQVADTFHTEIHRYRVAGVAHIANAQDPQVPAALAGVVDGIVSLHDFRHTPAIAARRALGARPLYSSGSTHYLFPADFAAIYNLNSLYGAGTNGAGTAIAIVGRSNIVPSDVASFRAQAGLAANSPTVILAGADPGLVSGDQDEATLDVEWSGAVAPAATVKLVAADSTATSDGVDLSAQYIVNHATAPVVSTSYGSCEQQMGASELAFYNSLWQQAASQGMSSFVASGDSGVAGCSAATASAGAGAGVNGLCSSPYSTCVGGTEFNEGSNDSTYWSSSNSASYGSALAYIPEVVWNESGSNGGSGLWASGGGASQVYAQPGWQQGVSGVSAANGMRAVPDVAMSAAGHDGYVIFENSSFWIISGTSAASPSFAGVMALVVQSQGGKGQGNANAALYPLLNAAHNPFHSTPSGNNSVQGEAGFTASGASFNLATGLGSVDGAVMVASWGPSPATGVDFALSASAAGGTVQPGSTATFAVSVTESGSASSAVTLAVKASAGVTATVQPATILPGTPATVTLTVASAAAAGAQNITVTGSDAYGSQSLTYTLTVPQAPSLALTAASTSVAVVQGASNMVSFTVSTGGSFSGNTSFSVSGLPAGVTAQWSANPLTAASSVSANPVSLTLSASASAPATSATLVVTAVGDGLVASQNLTLLVQPSSAVELAVTPTALSMSSLSTATVTVTATPSGSVTASANPGPGLLPSARRGIRPPLSGFSITGWGGGGVSISLVSGLPQGLIATWSAPTVSAAGAATWTLTLTGSSAAQAGSATLNLVARVTACPTAAVCTASQAVPLTITASSPAFKSALPVPVRRISPRRSAAQTLRPERSRSEYEQ
jgi:subtilase family serine protease